MNGTIKINRKLEPIILEEYCVNTRMNVGFEINVLNESSQFLFLPQLERWICNYVWGKDSIILQESIRTLHGTEIFKISDYIFKKLSGRRINNEQLKKCLIETLVELNIDLNEFRNISIEKLPRLCKKK